MKLRQSFRIEAGCTFGEQGDPRVVAYNQNPASAVYGSNGSVISVLKKSSPEKEVPDLCIFGLPGKFRGYYPGYSSQVFDPQIFTWAVLKGHAENNGGYIKLRSSDPLDTPEINFKYFGEGTDLSGSDLQGVLQGLREARRLQSSFPLDLLVDQETYPGIDFEAGCSQLVYRLFTSELTHSSQTCRTRYMIFEQNHYRDFLKEMLAERTRQNPQYSMRSLARHLKIQPSLLSEILRGTRKLTEETAMKIADRLEMNDLEREYLRLLIQLERAKTPSLKESVLASIRRIHPQPNSVQDLNVALFRVIADWYHFAILRLTEIEGFPWSNANVAKALGILEYDVERAIQRLLRLELIEIDASGRPHKVTNDLLVSSELPNAALKKYHAQMLDKTKAALLDQSPKERFTGTEDVILDSSQVKEAAEIFEEAFRKILDLSKAKKKKTSPEVFHLGIHLFKLTDISSQANSKKEKEVRK